MPWFPDSESGVFADVIDEPSPTLTTGNFPVPCTLEHAAVSLTVGPAVFDIVDQMVSDDIVAPEHRDAAAVIVASFFLPMLAREDRIAAYLGLDRAKVRQMGWRLRLGGIWQGECLAKDCYDELFADDVEGSSAISLMLFCMVAKGTIWAQRDNGEIFYSHAKPMPPVHVEGRPCQKCWSTLRYGNGGQCVACMRRYGRAYRGPLKP